MNFNSDSLHIYHQLFISFGLGLIVGLQREWAKAPLAGIRSHALVAVFGTVSAILSSKFGLWMVGGGLLATLAMIFFSKSEVETIQGREHRELVAEAAILLTYFVGVLVVTGPIFFASTLAGLLAILLHFKGEIHGLVRKLTPKEIKSILQFVLLTLVLLPLVPDQAFGPYGFFNPYNVWLMVILIVGIGLSGYLTSKFFGDRSGVVLSGLFGGLLSSTATTFSYAKIKELKSEAVGFCSKVILIAWATLYVRVFLELFVTAPGFTSIRIPLLVMLGSAMFPVLFKKKGQKILGSGDVPNANPTELKSALIFALMYSFVLLAASYLKEQLGSSGLTILGIIFGITDVDAITLSTGKLVESSQILEAEGHLTILTAIVSNVFFKGLLVFFFADSSLKKSIAYPWLLSLITGLTLIIIALL